MARVKFQRPPPHYPFGYGYVSPVFPSTPLPPPLPRPKYPHEDPVGQVPPVIPVDATPSAQWTNPFTDPVPLPRGPAETPVFPQPHHAWENAVVADVPLATPSIPIGTPHLQSSPGNRLWVRGTYPPEHYPLRAPLQLNPRLLYNPLNAGIPNLEWDITQRPDTATFYSGHHCFLRLDLKEPAFYPSAKKIYIESDHPTLRPWMESWGPLTIDQDKPISVGNILDAIYAYLQIPLTPQDRARIQGYEPDYSIPGEVDPWHALNFAKHCRVRESGRLQRFERKQGLKRVDILTSHRRFKGLRAVVFGSNEWKVYFGLLHITDFVTQRDNHRSGHLHT